MSIMPEYIIHLRKDKASICLHKQETSFLADQNNRQASETLVVKLSVGFKQLNNSVPHHENALIFVITFLNLHQALRRLHILSFDSQSFRSRAPDMVRKGKAVTGGGGTKVRERERIK